MGMVAVRAIVYDATLFKDKRDTSVCAVLGDSHHYARESGKRQSGDYCSALSHVVGWVLTPTPQVPFASKLKEADRLTGYPHSYQRHVVRAVRADDGTDLNVTMYHKQTTCEQHHRILSGDWLCDNGPDRLGWR
jgi:gamma-glutamylcyclotransferase (GGCT)/AIG2-like uncharacterized protein YtfP